MADDGGLAAKDRQRRWRREGEECCHLQCCTCSREQCLGEQRLEEELVEKLRGIPLAQ